MKITLTQTTLYWEQPDRNRTHLAERLERAAPHTDLIMLPEMCTTGFTMSPESLAETNQGQTVGWMRQLAKTYDAAVTGSIIAQENTAYFNRLLWVEPDGRCLHYDKKHLFSMATENDHYTAGNERLILKWRGWRICPMVCYDLRFPAWSRNLDLAYDLLLYVANWPAVRTKAWETLLPARAIENSAYVAGLNRIGEDGNGVDYCGQSGVFEPRGQTIAALADREVVKTVQLDKDALEAYRQKFPVHCDADRFVWAGAANSPL